MRHKMHKSSCNYDCILVLFLLMFFFPSLPLVKTFGIMECVKCRAVFAWWGACEEFGWVQYIKVICQVRQLRVKNGIIGHQMLNWEWNFRKQNNWEPRLVFPPILVVNWVSSPLPFSLSAFTGLEWTSSHQCTSSGPVQDEAVQAVLGMTQKHILFPCPGIFQPPSLPQNFPFIPPSLHFPLTPSPKLGRAPKLE